MVLSMGEWPRLRMVAAREGFEVQAVRSPDVPQREWDDAVERSAWSSDDRVAVRSAPAACHSWLRSLNHFPHGVVMHGPQTHPWPILGVMPDQAWIDSLAFRRAALNTLLEGLVQ